MHKHRLVTSHVGIIRSWQALDGTDILYPSSKTSNGNEYGGCYPAVPVFSKVPKTTTWSNVTLPEDGLVQLINESYNVESDHDSDDRYRTYFMNFPARESYPWSFSVSNRLDFSRDGLTLNYWITVSRNESCNTSLLMPLSFGLQSYFPIQGLHWEVGEHGRVLIDSKSPVGQPTNFNLKSEEVYLRAGRALYRLRFHNYDQITVRSNQPDKYICVGPSWGCREEITLRPGDGRSTRFSIEFLPNRF